PLGFGARVGWWHFEQDAGTWSFSQQAGTKVVTPEVLGDDNGANFDALDFTEAGRVWTFINELHMNVWDFEATDEIKAGCWSLLFTGGIRYARIAQSYAATSLEPEPGEAPDVLTASNVFTGAGPTVSLEARRPISDYGIAVYGIARTALLFGTT